MDLNQDIHHQQESMRQQLETCLAKGDQNSIRNLFEELLDAQRRCCALLKQANDAIVVFNLETRQIEDANPRAAEMFGYSCEELRNMTVCSLHPEAKREEIKAEYVKSITEGPHTISKLPVIKKDGSRMLVDVSAANIAKGKSPVVQGIYHDVTEVYQLYEQAEKRAQNSEAEKAQLEEAEQLRTEFLALISHELRTPLNSIIGYNSLLEEGVYGELEEKQLKAVQRVERNATRLLALINQLLELSRMEAGIISVFNEKVDMVKVVQEVLADYEVLAEEKGLKIELSQPYKGATVNTDVDKIREVARQLISNAIKFTSQGRVKIEIAEEDGITSLSVQDSGPGIDPAKRESIFGLFRQGDNQSTRRHPGAGLGLAIVKRLSDLLGIQVDLQSKEGEGSTFVVRFAPADDTSMVKSSPSSTLDESKDTVDSVSSKEGDDAEEINAQNILIVDDDPYTVELLSDFLEAKGGYRVQKAYSGMHAMMYLAQKCPDYLLVDLIMPQINGERVIQCCRDLWGDQVNIIIITGKNLTPNEIARLEKKADSIIQKGESTQGLTKALETVIPMPAVA